MYFTSCYNGTVSSSDVLCLLTDPILQHHGDGSHIIGSSLGSPDSEDSKDVEDLVSCHWEAEMVSIFCWPCLHREISYNPVPRFQRKESVCVLKQKLPVWNDCSALSLLRLVSSFVKGHSAASWSLMYCVSAGVSQCSKEPLLQCSLVASTWSVWIWHVTDVLGLHIWKTGHKSKIVGCSLLVLQQGLVCTCFMKTGWGFLHLLTLVIHGVRDCYISGRNIFHQRLQGAWAASWRKMVCIPISPGSVRLQLRKKTQKLMGLARSACSWGVRCWQRAELRKTTCEKSLSSLLLIFLHQYSKLNQKGRAVWKGSYRDPPAFPTSS